MKSIPEIHMTIPKIHIKICKLYNEVCQQGTSEDFKSIHRFYHKSNDDCYISRNEFMRMNIMARKYELSE